MPERMMEIVSVNRKKMVPVLIALSLLAGLFVSVFHTMKAQADYYAGCGYGYSSTGTFGYNQGQGNAFGYGYGVGGTFVSGYGSSVCPLAITTGALPAGLVGTAYSQTFTGTGGLSPYTWTEVGTLPPGLTLSTGGVLSGVPTTAGTFAFVVTMTDANGQPVSGSFSVAVAPLGGGGGGTTTSTSTTTTTVGTTTTTGAPTTTTTVFPSKGEPGLIYRHVVRTTATGTFLQFKCTVAANCQAIGKLVVRERTRTARGFRMTNTVVAQARFAIGRGQTATKYFPFNAAGKARYGGARHVHAHLQLWTSVVGGHHHARYIWLNR